MLGVVATGIGLFSGEGSENEGSHPIFTSIRGEQIELYGTGIYKNDSLSAAAQAIAQDGVTLVVGIPLLLVSLLLSLRGTIRGRLLLAGALGYFTYTYASYCFLAMYNDLFLVYVLLFLGQLICIYFGLSLGGAGGGVDEDAASGGKHWLHPAADRLPDYHAVVGPDCRRLAGWNRTCSA
ncbi:hypothetical protein ACFSQ7_23430 [Paenibacillus rhizoplanae]